MWRLVISQLLVPGVARRAGVGEDDALLELARVDVERDALDAVHAELDRRDAAVERRAVVLHAGRHANRLALDVHRDLQQVVRVATTRRSTAASAPQTAIVSADEPAMPAPAGDSPRVVSVAFSSR